jgi:hypothetical protein
MVLLAGERPSEGNELYPEAITPENPLSQPPVDPEKLIEVLATQYEPSLKALETLDKIFRKRNLLDTLTRLPGLADEDAIQNTRSYLQDWGAQLRQRTTPITRNIAAELPNQNLGPLHMEAGGVFTTNGRVYFEEDGVTYALTDLIPQNEINAGVRLANEEQWQLFLFEVTLAHGLKSGSKAEQSQEQPSL